MLRMEHDEGTLWLCLSCVLYYMVDQVHWQGFAIMIHKAGSENGCKAEGGSHCTARFRKDYICGTA